MSEQNNDKAFFINGGSLLMLAAICIVGYQVIHWLQTAEWEPVNILTLLTLDEEWRSWVYYPTNWVGFHTVLEFIPLSLTFGLIGFGMLYVADKE